VDGRITCGVLNLDRCALSTSIGAIAPGGDRFVLDTEWSLRVFGRDGKQIWWRPTPEITWGVNIARVKSMLWRCEKPCCRKA
jgi:hypothetical protein